MVVIKLKVKHSFRLLSFLPSPRVYSCFVFQFPLMAFKCKSKPDWSTLPPELLTSIADLFSAKLDILRYRAVCRSFHSSVPTPPKPQCPYPHLRMPSTILCQPQPEHRCFLKQSRLYAMEPLTKISKTQMWILRVEESGDGVSIVR